MLTINNTLDGYLKDVEIKGNTIQDIENLADIRSVGEKVEGQELYEIPVLSCGKNLFDINNIQRGFYIQSTSGEVHPVGDTTTPGVTDFIKVKPNTTYVIKYETDRTTMFGEYREDKTFISRTNTKKIITSNDTYYIRVQVGFSTLNEIQNIQLEEGTVATPYEPYQEDKITILSPTPLEKVGDVADRIICKDGVWGVEKNIVDFTLIGNEDWLITDLGTTLRGGYNPNLNLGGVEAISNRFVYESGYEVDKEHFYISNNAIWIFINKSLLSSATNNGIKEYLTKNNVLIKYPTTTQPQFIPLPHSQQVKLRTFANKTNISFLTEIEGTIKAQVPKSLGATVNTHTEQISNLNKELDRVKKLEESTVSTVETESDFTTVEATSNGYFEDVKLEGKTLVNTVTTYNVSRFSLRNAIKQDDGYFKLQYGATVNDSNVIPRYGVHLYKPNTTYTIVVDIKENTTGTFLGISAINSCINSTTISKRDFDNLTGISTITFKTRDDIKVSDKGVLPTYDLYFGIWKDGGDLSKHITFRYWVLEGDHTQNPPSYFEGLKSVGDGTDEIVVSSVINKFKHPYLVENGKAYLYNNGSLITNAQYNTSHFLIDNGEQHFINFNLNDGIDIHITYWNDSTFISGVLVKQSVNLDVPNNCNKILLTYDTRITDILLYSQQDKKRLLFYNEETQTWEKPILREWDSIEKHSDGKYYYHQRSGEVVLNGSEDWYIAGISSGDFRRFQLNRVGICHKPYDIVVISDKFKSVTNKEWALLEKKIEADSTSIYITTDILMVEGFKQWLQTNNVTVAYQLAQEKVYECTNIDLITYANETNYIVESGAIVPRTTLKVHNNISNVVSLLQKKVSLLESNITRYMIIQNRMQLASTYSADSVTFKVDYFSLCGDEENYDEDLYNLILNNILVGKDNYDYDKMFTMILDYASWNQISWEQFDILVGLMDIQHNPPVEELPTEDEVIEETPNEIM